MLGVWPVFSGLWKNFRGLDPGSETFSIKSPAVSILSSVGHMLFAGATQLCCPSREAVIDIRQMSGHGLALLSFTEHSQPGLAHRPQETAVPWGR